MILLLSSGRKDVKGPITLLYSILEVVQHTSILGLTTDPPWLFHMGKGKGHDGIAFLRNVGV